LTDKSVRLLLILVGGVAVIVVAFHPKRGADSRIAPVASGDRPNVPPASPISGLALKAGRSPDSAFHEAFEAARTGADARSMRQRLAELRDRLAAMPRQEAVAAVRKWLDSKTDAPTHLGFQLASNGQLNEAPTLRTFLLDELGRLEPAAAADEAKVILASMDSPDEWAVALRDLALGDSSDAGRQLLEQKMSDMLGYAAWQQNPSVGYLEAFDVAVYLGGTDLLPALSGLVRTQDNPAVAHASYLALDRLVINDPTTTLGALEQDPTMMEGRESTRADYFARANVADAQQRQIVEAYLLNPEISGNELNTFASVFPNANFMVSPNLLTQTALPDRAALDDLDSASLSVVQQWQADPRFANLQPALQKMAGRLQLFVQQTAANQ
jgi:hypothetical protein